jgi:hypothetical protein
LKPLFLPIRIGKKRNIMEGVEVMDNTQFGPGVKPAETDKPIEGATPVQSKQPDGMPDRGFVSYYGNNFTVLLKPTVWYWQHDGNDPCGQASWAAHTPGPQDYVVIAGKCDDVGDKYEFQLY